MRDLIIRYRETPSEETLSEIFEIHHGMINSLAHKFIVSINNYDFEDLVREAQLELCSALRAYDLSSNTSFSTYVYSRIKHRFIKIIRYNKAKKRNMGNYVTLETKIANTNLTYETLVSDSTINLYTTSDEDLYIDALEYIKTILKEKELELYLYYLKTNDFKKVALKFKIKENNAKNKITYIRRKIRNKRKI